MSLSIGVSLRRYLSANEKSFTFLAGMAVFLGYVFLSTGCSSSSSSSSDGSTASAVQSYCSYISSPASYSSPVTVTGTAFYEFRVNGNGYVANGSKTLTASSTISNGQIYELTVGGTTFTYTCGSATCTAATGLAQLASNINSNGTTGASASVSSSQLVLSPISEGTAFSVSGLTNLSAYNTHTITFNSSTISNGQSYQLSINGTAFTYSCTSSTCSSTTALAKLASDINGTGFTTSSFKAVAMTDGSKLILGPKTESDTVAVTALTNLTDTYGAEPNPIRRAEVEAVNSSGTIVQCTETDDSGAFSMNIPSDGGTYTVKVLARSNNSYNTTYILTNPTSNGLYSVSGTVTASGSPSALRLVAKASGTLEGGAFNILDQIYRAQDYVRTKTSGCGTGGSGTYFSECEPVTSFPLLYVYWAPGVNPGSYVGTSGGLSFYIGNSSGSTSVPHALYILGGLNGDTDSSDMDHYDNSVIVHEYGHYIEDQFGNPNSPGGSHDGNSLIDPRLAWGEGWADFFQAAVNNNPMYRDTYGHFGCGTSCAGINFNEFLDPASSDSYDDKPTTAGEGGFREFAVTRMLWDVIKPGGTSQFSEIWTALNSSTHGMKVVSDVFKSMGRFLLIQTGISSKTDWSSIASDEDQTQSVAQYGNSLLTSSGCSPTSTAMTIKKTVSDDGSFAKSDQFRNNDFYTYTHTGGTLSIQLTWSGAGIADLDLYLYKSGYVYGSSSYIVAKDDASSSSTSGSASISQSVPAGTYMINIMAYTGVYSSVGNYNTSYTLTINGHTACPAP